MTREKGTALVTGASGGIGRELAQRFAEGGHDLVLVSRAADELKAVSRELQARYGIEAIPLVKDLYRPEAPREIYEEVTFMGIEIEYLVNDAGQGAYGPFLEAELERELAIVQLNVKAMLALTKVFVRDMVAHGYGRILQIAPMVGSGPAALSAVYSGTRAFVHHFSETLARELEGSGVTVTSLCPGANDTEFSRGERDGAMRIAREGELAAPAEVAREAYKALVRGDTAVVTGMKNRLVDRPRSIRSDRAIAKRMRLQRDVVRPSRTARGARKSRAGAGRARAH
jgi:uncharacterized protein